MIILLFMMLYATQIITQNCECLDLIDIPHQRSDMYEQYPRNRLSKKHHRRYWLVNEKPEDKINFKSSVRTYEDEKDVNLKNKIQTLVQQTMHDANMKMETVEQIKKKYREQASYRAGFVLSLIKQSRDILNELFNVAVKHRDQWKSLEQLKIFELIVHTNVDTTHLLRQLVEIHLGYLNSTSSTQSPKVLVI